MPFDNERQIEPWRKHFLMAVVSVGILVSLAVVVALTWAILYIHQDKATMEHIHAKIISIDSSKRSSFGRSIKFGRYDITVEYRTADGKLETTSFSKNTYGFPSAGDSITLLISQYGHIESDPFPELWIILVLVYGGVGALLWFFTKGLLTIRRWRTPS